MVVLAQSQKNKSDKNSLLNSDAFSSFKMLSPIGAIGIQSTEQSLISVTLQPSANNTYALRDPENPVEQNTSEAIKRYFLQDFEGYQKALSKIPLSLEQGTTFQRQVWQALMEIPCGETRSYEWIANAIDNPRAIRAVGQANRRNPFPILVPCHRVVNKNGELGGYMGQNDPQTNASSIKQKLLQLEQG